jgi:hypothetical protein
VNSGSNEGVAFHIVLLHELVPGKEAKIEWQESLEGKYDSSSFGKQLWQKGLVRC